MGSRSAVAKANLQEAALRKQVAQAQNLPRTALQQKLLLVRAQHSLTAFDYQVEAANKVLAAARIHVQHTQPGTAARKSAAAAAQQAQTALKEARGRQADAAANVATLNTLYRTAKIAAAHASPPQVPTVSPGRSKAAPKEKSVA